MAAANAASVHVAVPQQAGLLSKSILEKPLNRGGRLECPYVHIRSFRGHIMTEPRVTFRRVKEP